MPDIFEDSYNHESGNNNISRGKYKRERQWGALLIVLFGCMIFLFVGLSWVIIHNLGLKNSIEVTATICDIIVTEPSGSAADYTTSYTYTAKYEFVIDGRVYYAIYPYDGGKIGDQKTIYVDKNDYSRIYEKPWGGYFFTGLGAAGAIFFTVFFFKKPAKRAKNVARIR